MSGIRAESKIARRIRTKTWRYLNGTLMHKDPPGLLQPQPPPFLRARISERIHIGTSDDAGTSVPQSDERSIWRPGRGAYYNGTALDYDPQEDEFNQRDGYEHIYSLHCERAGRGV